MLQLNMKSAVPIWEQIVNGVKEQIIIGILQPKDKVLSVREMAVTLGVNPNTVSKAYQELERQGIIETLRGKGTFIASILPTSADESQLLQLKEKIRLLLVEAHYLGISTDQFIPLLQEVAAQLEEE
ncbi:MAG: GntR family transcriptional regulator [Bacillaceae bacterium]